MTTTLTPPPAAPPQPPTRGAARPIAITIAVVGGVVGVATIASGVAAAWPSSPSEQVVLELDADAIVDATSLDLDAGSADVTVEFADVDAATLTIVAPDADRWRLDVSGTTITAGDPRGWWSWGWGIGQGTERTATLVLPSTLAGSLDGAIEIGSGRLDVAGEWRDLDVDLASGRASVVASATSAAIDVASGSAELDLVVDGDVRLDLASGEILATLEHTGDLAVEVATGRVDARLVGGPYVVTTDVALGSADVEVDQSTGAEQAIHVELATGSVLLTDG